MKPVDCPMYEGTLPTEDAMLIEDMDEKGLDPDKLIQECLYWETFTLENGRKVFWIVLESNPEVVIPLSRTALVDFVKDIRGKRMLLTG